MSREEQIGWWQANREPAPTKPHMKEAIGWYEEGQVTATDFCNSVARFAALEDLKEFMTACPPHLMAVLREYLASYGEDESVWPRTFFIASYAPWVSPEQIEASKRQEQEQIWNGVRLLKRCLVQ